MSPKPERPIWSFDSGQRIPACFDSCQFKITIWMTQIKDIAMVMVLLSYFSRYWRTDEQTLKPPLTEAL